MPRDDAQVREQDAEIIDSMKDDAWHGNEHGVDQAEAHLLERSGRRRHLPGAARADDELCPGYR